jgi:hypothetical protein
MLMKTRCFVGLPDDDRTISISLISGKVIRLRPSELAACELVARLLRKAITKQGRHRAFQILMEPSKLKPRSRRRRTSSLGAAI